jgi:sec-independent protein translocase protein TatA
MIGDILQPTHLIFILVVALLVLGPKRLPEAGRALGKGLRDFRTAMSGDEDHHSELPTEAPAPPPRTAAPLAATPPVEPVEHVDHVDHVEPIAPTPPPVDHAIQAAVYAAAPVEDATAEPADMDEQHAESAHPVG